MLKFLFKIFTVLFLASFLGGVQNVSAQPADKAKERINQVKKVKLLDLLELDEAASEKFLSKYNAWERKIEDKKNELEEAYKSLEQSIQNNASDEEINQKTALVLKLQDELQQLHEDKVKAMKSVLNETQYGKYLIFENNFMKELQNILVKQYKLNMKPRRK